MTRSSDGQYVMHTKKTYSKLKCSFGNLLQLVGGDAGVAGSSGVCPGTCNSLDVKTLDDDTATSAWADTFGTINCMGEY